MVVVDDDDDNDAACAIDDDGNCCCDDCAADGKTEIVVVGVEGCRAVARTNACPQLLVATLCHCCQLPM